MIKPSRSLSQRRHLSPDRLLTAFAPVRSIHRLIGEGNMITHHCLFRVFTALVIFILLGLPSTRVHADIAPPQQPPGANLSPGAESTRVRMAAETVTLEVSATPASGSLGQAQVTAVFDMLNTGSADETMPVRFPLTFSDGRSDGWGNFPVIAGLQVKVNGQPVATRQVDEPNPGPLYTGLIPWAVFDVTFPAGKTVQVEVSYPMEAWGEDPYIVFGYVLETGAGWFDTIGTADLILRLPYEANEQNVMVSDNPGFGGTSPGVEINGNDLHWRLTDFEPAFVDNLKVMLVSPVLWKKILTEREAVRRNPQDGEAWGRLGKACKAAILERKGFLRQDAGGQALFEEGAAAYEKSVSLLPDDALWHFGFAELLWRQYLSRDYRTYAHDQSLLVRAVDELKASLDLEPGNERSLELAQEIAWLRDGVIIFGHPFEYPILTATLVYPTQYPTLMLLEESATATAPPVPTAAPLAIEPTPTPRVVAQAAPVEPEQPAQESKPQKPGVAVNLCGAIFLPLLAVAVVWKARMRVL